MIYTASIMPYRIALINNKDNKWDNLEIAIDYIFMIDILINFFSAYFDEYDILIVDLKVLLVIFSEIIKIKKNY